MAPALEPRMGQKRGPGRPPRDAATPASKKLKTTSVVRTSPALASPSIRSPALDTPAPVKRVARLPAKVSASDNKPLPALPEPQPLSLSDDEYQGIAASAVLAAALERSRLRWTCHGVFQKHWLKPETGKNAKPPPPNNPDVKSMKIRGECRIRLEPHVFTADVYVEERAKVAVSSKQYGGYGPQYRPPQHPLPPFQNRPLQPGSNLGTPQSAHHQQSSHPRHAPSPAPEPLKDKKASPDPVISLLASRASSDPELKGLMKEVATGYANQEQLRVFQKHIDELTEIIKEQKKAEEEQQADTIQYGGQGEAKPTSSIPTASVAQQQPLPPPPPPRVYQAPQQPPPPPYQPQQAMWTPPPINNIPLILAFKDPGACEDRFLFPQMSILESLSPQHELVSFMVVKKGREAADPSGLEPDKEYWQPVTMMVEVAYGREDILDCIRRWVRPADEVRKHMENVMQNCLRAPSTYLALRLPYKGCAQTESEVVSKEATPITEEKIRPKAVSKTLKKLATSATSTSPSTPLAKKGADPPIDGTTVAATPPVTATTVPNLVTTNPAAPATATEKDGIKKEPATTEGDRPRRALRKSARLESS